MWSFARLATVLDPPGADDPPHLLTGFDRVPLDGIDDAGFPDLPGRWGFVEEWQLTTSTSSSNVNVFQHDGACFLAPPRPRVGMAIFSPGTTSCGAPVRDAVYFVPGASAMSGGSRLLNSNDQPAFTVPAGVGATKPDAALDADIADIFDDPGGQLPPGTPQPVKDEVASAVGAFVRCMDYLAGDPSLPTGFLGGVDPCGDTVGEKQPEPDMEGDWTVDRPVPVEPGSVGDPVEDFPRPGEDPAYDPDQPSLEQPAPDPTEPPDPGEEVAKPPAAVPDCAGTLYAECAQRLEQAGFDAVTRDTLGFEDAQLDKPADAVIGTQPLAGVQHPTGSPVVVTANPDTDAMPIEIPAPQQDEELDDYIGRLRARHIDYSLSEQFPVDATKAPGSVISVEPKGRQRRGTKPEVKSQREDDCDLGDRIDPYETWNVADMWDPYELPGAPAVFQTSEGPTTLYWGEARPSETEGWTGFGYRKIAAKHGWSRHDDASTRQALLMPGGEASSPKYRQFVGADFFSLGGRTRCQRVVVVEFQPHDGDRAKGIVTSFGRAKSGG